MSPASCKTSHSCLSCKDEAVLKVCFYALHNVKKKVFLSIKLADGQHFIALESRYVPNDIDCIVYKLSMYWSGRHCTWSVRDETPFLWFFKATSVNGRKALTSRSKVHACDNIWLEQLHCNYAYDNKEPEHDYHSHMMLMSVSAWVPFFQNSS